MALKTNQMHTDFKKYWGNFDNIFVKNDGKKYNTVAENDGKIEKEEYIKQDKGIFKVNRYE